MFKVFEHYVLILDINECFFANSYNNGTCLDKVNGSMCICAEGYTRERCETGLF